MLGLGLQIFTTIGILFPAIAFFFANTSSGWRYLAAFSVVMGAVNLLLEPTMCVESPASLLTQGRKKPETAEEGLAAPKKESMFNPRYRMQLLSGILLSCAQQVVGVSYPYISDALNDHVLVS
ncbi:hypothetical protein PR001_g10941 [Phytophthora rubi]|uniref:Major facilitator superfamily (MFS) profile domain-containing protein n=1 Tax=Phytophthora rubi TaxID=129364 RepID=A0A6A3MSE8_9STRA|nr:hypothetical protein PR001_g10941 [Phytophthora rubi]